MPRRVVSHFLGPARGTQVAATEPTFRLAVKITNTTSIGFPAAGPLFPVFRAGFGALTGDSAIRPSENTMQGANGGKTRMCEHSGYLEIMF